MMLTRFSRLMYQSIVLKRWLKSGPIVSFPHACLNFYALGKHVWSVILTKSDRTRNTAGFKKGSIVITSSMSSQICNRPLTQCFYNSSSEWTFTSTNVCILIFLGLICLFSSFFCMFFDRGGRFQPRKMSCGRMGWQVDSCQCVPSFMNQIMYLD
jgi:hypothetical protein